MAESKVPASEDIQPITQPSTELQEQIRFRAFELYVQRGGDHGHDLDDWLQAEFEITGPMVEKSAA